MFFKRFIICFTLALLLPIFSSCTFSDPIIDSLPRYTGKSFFTSGGFQDYTDYAKYTYDSITVQDFEASEFFRTVTFADVEEILLYIDNFEEWVQITGGKLQANYDFDKSVVSQGDFFYIKTKDTYGKYDDYTVYYFDVDVLTLYYFHNNI